jgi:GlpG protein
MRLIGSFSHQYEAERFVHLLKKESIVSLAEPKVEGDTVTYIIWVHDEDQTEKAMRLLEAFRQNPDDPTYTVPPPPPAEILIQTPSQKKYPLTLFILFVCIVLFLINLIERHHLPTQELGSLITKPSSLLLYDYPPPFPEIYRIARSYRKEAASPEEQARFQRAMGVFEAAPVFGGLYKQLIYSLHQRRWIPPEGPLFYQLRHHAQIWRLASPALFHTRFLHLLFNMLWLWVLMPAIEARLGFFRLLSFTLAAAVVSNTVQYLLSGPFFLGYSGVLSAFASFIWIRQRRAPWEGYSISKSNLLFLFGFIALMFSLQMISFVFEFFGNPSQIPTFQVANGSHLSGLLVGYLAAHLSFFSWRKRYL